jgi:hypothetical protein
MNAKINSFVSEGIGIGQNNKNSQFLIKFWYIGTSSDNETDIYLRFFFLFVIYKVCATPYDSPVLIQYISCMYVYLRTSLITTLYIVVIMDTVLNIAFRSVTHHTVQKVYKYR